jgi:hypothetical protein
VAILAAAPAPHLEQDPVVDTIVYHEGNRRPGCLRRHDENAHGRDALSNEAPTEGRNRDGLHVRAYNLTRVLNISGIKPLIAAMRAEDALNSGGCAISELFMKPRGRTKLASTSNPLQPVFYAAKTHLGHREA